MNKKCIKEKTGVFLVAMLFVAQMFSAPVIATASGAFQDDTAEVEVMNVFDVLAGDEAVESSDAASVPAPAKKREEADSGKINEEEYIELLPQVEAEPAKGYRMAPGDRISIKVFGEEDLSISSLKLGNHGTINYPFLGDIRVTGMAVAELERFITSGLKDGYLRDPQVRVNIVEYRQFYVNGEVKRPGGYQFQPGLTLRKAISLAGGFSKGSSEGQVLVIHEFADPDERARQMPLDSEVAPGDIITVKQSLFYVNGEVARPGGYAFQPDLTVRMAVSLAGGFTERAARDEALVIRKSDPGQAAIKLPLTAEILPGDIITVEQSFF